jgi:hypothetical protein
MLSTTARIASRVSTRRAAVFGTSITNSPLARSYHENIVEHYENPRNVGSLDKNELSVGTVRFLSVYPFQFEYNTI